MKVACYGLWMWCVADAQVALFSWPCFQDVLGGRVRNDERISFSAREALSAIGTTGVSRVAYAGESLA